MCLENYPECGDGGDGCCERRLTIALECARRDTLGPIPRIWARRVDFQLYAVWTERNERRIADTIGACCSVCAKAEFIGKYFIVDKAEAKGTRRTRLPRVGSALQATSCASRRRGHVNAPSWIE
jgi:hypothetical protein